MKKKQKTVWITGASSGIGLAFAKAYAKKGYRLILTARRQGRLEKLADNLGVPCRIETADLFKEKECYRVCEILKEETIDIFINNAGFGNCGDFARTDLSKDMDMIRVNVEAMHILCKEVLRQMQVKGKGTILNVASSAGLLPGGALYGNLLCDQGICCQSDKKYCRGTAGEKKRCLCLRALSGTCRYRV